jgi:hypothetical protein
MTPAAVAEEERAETRRRQQDLHRAHRRKLLTQSHVSGQILLLKDSYETSLNEWRAGCHPQGRRVSDGPLCSDRLPSRCLKPIGHLVNRDIVTIETSSSRTKNGLLAMFSDSGSSGLERLAKEARRKFGRGRVASRSAEFANSANLNRDKRRYRSRSVPHGGVQ